MLLKVYEEPLHVLECLVVKIVFVCCFEGLVFWLFC